jgi:hypothetical protein
MYVNPKTGERIDFARAEGRFAKQVEKRENPRWRCWPRMAAGIAERWIMRGLAAC